MWSMLIEHTRPLGITLNWKTIDWSREKKPKLILMHLGRGLGRGLEKISLGQKYSSNNSYLTFCVFSSIALKIRNRHLTLINNSSFRSLE